MIVEFTNKKAVDKAKSIDGVKFNDTTMNIEKYNMEKKEINLNENSDDSAEYDTFFNEYRQYFKSTHKYQKRIQNQKEGELNIPELLIQANNL